MNRCREQLTCTKVSELLLFNTEWTIFQLNHGENMLHTNEMMTFALFYINMLC
jgi:hypothetical protein